MLFRTLSVLWILHKNAISKVAVYPLECLHWTLAFYSWIIFGFWFTLSNFLTWLVMLTPIHQSFPHQHIYLLHLNSKLGVSQQMMLSYIYKLAQKKSSFISQQDFTSRRISKWVHENSFWAFVSSFYSDVHMFIFMSAGMHLVKLAVSSWNTLLKRKKRRGSIEMQSEAAAFII